MKPGIKLLLFITMAGALAGVFALYGRPEFLMTLANQVWGCF